MNKNLSRSLEILFDLSYTIFILKYFHWVTLEPVLGPWLQRFLKQTVQLLHHNSYVLSVNIKSQKKLINLVMFYMLIEILPVQHQDGYKLFITHSNIIVQCAWQRCISLFSTMNFHTCLY